MTRTLGFVLVGIALFMAAFAPFLAPQAVGDRAEGLLNAPPTLPRADRALFKVASAVMLWGIALTGLAFVRHGEVDERGPVLAERDPGLVTGDVEVRHVALDLHFLHDRG